MGEGSTGLEIGVSANLEIDVDPLCVYLCCVCGAVFFRQSRAVKVPRCGGCDRSEKGETRQFKTVHCSSSYSYDHPFPLSPTPFFTETLAFVRRSFRLPFRTLQVSSWIGEALHPRPFTCSIFGNAVQPPPLRIRISSFALCRSSHSSLHTVQQRSNTIRKYPFCTFRKR